MTVKQGPHSRLGLLCEARPLDRDLKAHSRDAPLFLRLFIGGKTG